jgi:hypothetical protein
MKRYNWLRPHQYNGDMPPACAEEKPIHCPGPVEHYNRSYYQGKGGMHLRQGWYRLWLAISE